MWPLRLSRKSFIQFTLEGLRGGVSPCVSVQTYKINLHCDIFSLRNVIFKEKIKLKELKANFSINLENVLITVYSDKKLYVKSDIFAKRTKIHTRYLLYMY